MEGVDMMERNQEVADGVYLASDGTCLSQVVFVDLPPTVRIFTTDEGEDDTVDTTGDDTPRNRRLSNASEATVTLHHGHGSDTSATIVASSQDSQCAICSR
jgi:hypothetical protein